LLALWNEVELTLCDEPEIPFSIKEALYQVKALQNAIKHRDRPAGCASVLRAGNIGLEVSTMALASTAGVPEPGCARCVSGP
jgi:hypothetical protein